MDTTIKQINSFAPIINKDCTTLILGSMPGIESLRKNEYYGYKNNTFWRIMFRLFDEEYSDNYTVKKQLLLENNIALWDVIKSCERDGSLDSNIIRDKPNDFEGLYREYPNIKHIFFNGTKAYKTYISKIRLDDKRKFTKLPSTSPAHAMKFEKKLNDWRIIKDFQYIQSKIT